MKTSNPRPPARSREQGLVTLLALLVLVSAGAFFLLRALNRAGQGPAAAETQQALRAARDALIGYAVRYPDTPGVPAGAGPGRLPCPDTRVDAGEPVGAADSPCALASGSTTGRFPWHTLDVPELVDGSGAPLWYAVSDPHRAFLSAALGPDTRGALGLDRCAPGGDDVVALVLAPGPALAGQVREPSGYAALSYLEGDNVSAQDGCFTTRSDALAPDAVLAIGRTALMQAVGNRVLEDVANALARYRAAHGAYPWLQAFAAPATSSYRGTPGVRRGQLPLRRSEASGADPRVFAGNVFAFPAAFLLRWTVPTAGVATFSGTQPPSLACLRSSADPACDSGGALSVAVTLAGDVTGTAGGEWAPGLCKAIAGRRLSCRAEREVVDPGGSGRLRRSYTLVLDRWAYVLAAPTVDRPRRQQFTRTAEALRTTPLAEAAALTLADVHVADDGTLTVLGDATLNLAAGDDVDLLSLTEVPFDLEVDDDDEIDPVDPTLDPEPDTLDLTVRSPGELPAWLTANNWHQLLLVAYAQSFAPGDSAVPCATHAGGCLAVAWSRAGAPVTALADVAALVVQAGPALTDPAQARPGTVPADYFEGANTSDDDAFAAGDATAAFNDQVRILAPDE